MKNLKVMMMTLMIIFIGFNSHTQEILNENNIEKINLRLDESSSYLIKANNQAIGSVATGIATSLIAGLLLNRKSDGINKQMGTVIAVGGGITSLSLGISSIVNKRKGYKKLGGLKL